MLITSWATGRPTLRQSCALLTGCPRCHPTVPGVKALPSLPALGAKGRPTIWPRALYFRIAPAAALLITGDAAGPGDQRKATKIAAHVFNRLEPAIVLLILGAKGLIDNSEPGGQKRATSF